ncbi:hypothetical protein J6590_031220 [Homalodisca vitripennis]|nr:hypothetical protein J6590_031220 [Homalodisca vitripennis]
MDFCLSRLQGSGGLKWTRSAQLRFLHFFIVCKETIALATYLSKSPVVNGGEWSERVESCTPVD